MSRETTPPISEAKTPPPRHGRSERRKRKSDKFADEVQKRPKEEQIAAFISRKSSKLKSISLADFPPLEEIEDSKELELIILLRRIQEIEQEASPKYNVTHKTAGFNSGFVVVNEDSGRRFFVKEFLNPAVKGGINDEEIFIYNVLHRLGYGPKCHIVAYPNLTAMLISEDLSRVKGGETPTVKEFLTYEQLLAVEIAFPDPFYDHLITTQLLTTLLGLNDVHHNDENAGVVITTGPKTVGQDPKIKPYIIDFTTRSLPDTPDPQPSAQFKLESVIAMAENTSHSRLHISRIERERKEQAYQNAAKYLLQGRAKRPPILEAIDQAFEDCKEITDGEISENLSKIMRLTKERVTNLHSYISELETHLATP